MLMDYGFCRFMAASKVLGEETAAGAGVNEKGKNGQK